MARPPKYPASKVVRILAEHTEGGFTIQSLCKHYGMSIQTYYRWKERYEGMTVDKAGEFRELILENSRLRRVRRKNEKEIRALEDCLARTAVG